ncbi:MAG TPA: hypothetical protein VMF51_07410 [Nocardioides sp.]|uniref:hypothetical protein n=1 Tax=Nocardioides sp. TaxID=35761 RepID=UPI002B574125|nr:hypothetical protein [Nocardioides sp.]HTW14939.1 hypothetical protein [Nocardioides sp.]
MNEQQISTLLRAEWDDLPVGPAPVHLVEKLAERDRRRQAGRRWGGIVGVAAATLLAVALVTTRGDTEDPRPVGPVVDNPADVSWTDGFTLHLDRTTLTVGDELDDLVAWHSRVAEDGGRYGVVYASVDGDVIHVDSLGRVRTIGRTGADDTYVAASTVSPWSAWVDATEGHPALVVHDTAKNKQVAREPLPAAALAGPAVDPVRRSMAIAVDGERVWVRTPTGDLVWEPGRPLKASPYAGSWVLDAADRTVVTSPADPTVPSLVTVASASGPSYSVRGSGNAAVSPDGRHVLVGMAPIGNASLAWKVYDAASGEPVGIETPSLGQSDEIEQAVLGETSAVFVVGRDRTLPEEGSGSASEFQRQEIVSCPLSGDPCVTQMSIPGAELDSGRLVLEH